MGVVTAEKKIQEEEKEFYFSTEFLGLFLFLYFQLTPVSKRGKLRQYSPTQLTNAYKACIEDKVPVYPAAKYYNVPQTTRAITCKRVSGSV